MGFLFSYQREEIEEWTRQCAGLETYFLKHSDRIHRSNLQEAGITSVKDMFGERDELLLDVYIMDREEYDSVLLQNLSEKFTDHYDPEDKVAVIILRKEDFKERE